MTGKRETPSPFINEYDVIRCYLEGLMSIRGDIQVGVPHLSLGSSITFDGGSQHAVIVDFSGQQQSFMSRVQVQDISSTACSSPIAPLVGNIVHAGTTTERTKYESLLLDLKPVISTSIITELPDTLLLAHETPDQHRSYTTLPIDQPSHSTDTGTVAHILTNVVSGVLQTDYAEATNPFE